MARQYDALILDRQLPDLDGLVVVATLRGIGMKIPVLMMMSASADAGQRIEGLRAGVDDYLCMPLSSEEMLIRVEVLLRRRSSAPSPATILRIAELELDLVHRKPTPDTRRETQQNRYQSSATAWAVRLGAPPGPAGSGLPKRGKAPSERARSTSMRTSARVFGAWVEIAGVEARTGSFCVICTTCVAGGGCATNCAAAGAAEAGCASTGEATARASGGLAATGPDS
jgi:ActR/RegA family two-component response regulator